MRGWMGGTLRLIAVLALVLGGLGLSHVSMAHAQLAGAQTFSRIVVRGNQRIETATIRNFTGIIPGQPATPGQVNAAYQRLLATGLFEEVTVTPRGNSLIVEVREYPTINRINFERNKRIKDERLAEIITSQPRRTYSPEQAEADAALIVEAYRQSGRFSVEVTPKIIRRADNRVDLVFEIFEGKVVEIQRLAFVGNRSFSDRRLRRVLATKQAGLLRGFIRSDTFIADRIEFDKQVLRDFYLSRGFIDFQVLSAASEVARERNGFFVTFKLREGQSYDFGDITTTSSLTDVDPDAFQAIVKIRRGVTYSPNLLENTITRMELLATRKGLNFIRVNPRVTRNDDDRTLDIEFVIERGPRIFVERIDIEGNTTTLDRVIRRQFDTVEGDPFNPRQIRQAAERIRALGFFAASEVTTREGSSSDRVIVDVNVEEQPTGSLNFGISYGATSGVGGVVSLSESNFLGRGQFLKAELGGGTNNVNSELTFAEPSFLDRDVRLELSAFRRTTTQANAFYDTVTTGIAPKLAFPVSERGRMELSYRRSEDIVNNITGTPSPIIVAGSRNVSAFGFTYTFDSRSSGLNPRAGTILRFSQELAGPGGSARYSKTSALIGGRTRILNEAIGLSLELEGGYLKDFSGTSVITDRFFMRGDVMRGFALNGIGPRDLNVANQDALGGNMFAVARFEAQFPIGLPEEYRITGGLFYDIGSVWGLDNTDGGASGVDGLQLVDDSLILRQVVGFSIFWQTGLGPLRFNFTKVLSGPAYDVPETFSLTIGTSF